MGMARQVPSGDPSLRRMVLGSAAVSMSVRSTGLLLGFGANILLSRALGTFQYGLYAIALSFALVAVIPARFGLDQAALKFASVYKDREDHRSWHGFVIASVAITTAISIAISLGLLLFWKSGREDLTLTAWAGVSVFLVTVALLGICSSLMRVSNRIFASQFYDQVLRPLIFMGALWFGREFVVNSSDHALLATAAIATFCCIAIWVHYALVHRDLFRAAPKFHDRKLWVKLGWSMLLISGLQELANQIDVLLLGRLSSPEAAGLFAAAWRIASLVPFALAAISTIGGPLVAVRFSNKDMKGLSTLAHLCARASLTLGLVMTCLLVAMGSLILGWFGPGFPDAYPALCVLLFGGIVNAGTGMCGYLLTLTGNQVAALLILFGTLVLNIVLTCLLAPSFGVLGSAISTSCSVSASNILMCFIVRRRMGIDTSALGLPPRKRVDEHGPIHSGPQRDRGV